MRRELTPEIKLALEKINFKNRYKELSYKYVCEVDDTFESFEIKKVLSIIEELGYKARYFKGEKFFSITDKISSVKFLFNMVLKYGYAEFTWEVWKNDEIQRMGPWMLIDRLLEDEGKYLGFPSFRDYEELKAILKEALSIYEDFKRELFAIYDDFDNVLD